MAGIISILFYGILVVIGMVVAVMVLWQVIKLLWAILSDVSGLIFAGIVFILLIIFVGIFG